MSKKKTKAKEVAELYPPTVDIGGKPYAVQVDLDSDGLIEYFNLVDAAGEFFFEADWVAGSLTADEIREIVRDMSGEEQEEASEKETPASNAVATGAGEADSADGQGEEAPIDSYWAEVYDGRYGRYSHLGAAFRREAIETLECNEMESRVYQNILISELADYYEDRAEEQH